MRTDGIFFSIIIPGAANRSIPIGQMTEITRKDSGGKFSVVQIRGLQLCSKHQAKVKLSREYGHDVYIGDRNRGVHFKLHAAACLMTSEAHQTVKIARSSR